MTQTSDSSSDPQGYFGALLYESDGDFFVELDSLLQSVGDFDAKKNPEATSWDSDVGTSLLTATRSVLDAPTGVTRDPSPTSCLGSSSAEEVRSSVVTSKHKLAPTSTSVPMRAEERKKNQNRSRKRQREEIEHLRASADELQIQLEGLLTGSSDKPIHLSHKQMQTYLHETLAWKRTAASEQQQAEQGVKKNLQLRALIDENKVICKSLHDTCTKSRVSSVSHIGSTFTYVAMKKPAVLPDSGIFDSLRQGLDAQYQQLNSILDTYNFTSASVRTKQRNRFRIDGDGQLFFEHANPHVFPFAASAVSQAIWRLTKGGLHTPSNGELKVCRVVGNTLYVTLTDTILVPNSPDSLIKMWMVMKRFIEDDQVVMVWRAKVEIQHTCSIRLTECGWNTTRGLVGFAGNLKAAPCISQTHIHSYPDPDCPVSRAEMVTGSLTEKVVMQYHHNMSMFNQKIENILLDESFAISHC